MSWCSHSSTHIVHLFLTFHPLLLTVFIFSFQGLNPIEIDCPQSLTLRAFSPSLVWLRHWRLDGWWSLALLTTHTPATTSVQARRDLTWGGNEKNMSHSQMSVQHANNKNKLVDFAVVSGWRALAGRWCSASSACFSTEFQVYLNGQWRELFKLNVMMHHGLIAPHLRRNNVCRNMHQKWTTLLQYFLNG
jgi:hypothetical protein